MRNESAFEELLKMLKEGPETSLLVKAQVLTDMGVNHNQLAEASGRQIRRRSIIVRGSDGLPMDEIEFEFLPKEEHL